MTAAGSGGRGVSIITVTYQSRDIVAEALTSAVASAVEAGVESEIIVVDNASNDGSADTVEAAFPAARVIRNAANPGFGAANNQAFAVARMPYWLLLNPDARLGRQALRTLLDALTSSPRAVAAAPSIRTPGRSAESAGMHPSIRSAIAHFLFLNRVVARLGGPWKGFQLRPALDEPALVDWASAAALLVRGDAVRRSGAFDETIFLYGEDIDLCARLRAGGGEVWLVPAATAEHAIAGTQPGISSRWIDGLHDVYSREASRLQVLVFDLVVSLGLGVRAIAARPGSRQSRRMAAAARRAATLAVRGGMARISSGQRW